MHLHETDPLLKRRMTTWNDPDREGAWRLYTLCRGCAEVKFCRGKERDGVVCLDCFLSDAPKVPFFELGLWDYSDAAGAKREHARGLAMLEQRKAEADEARRRNLEEARKRRRAEREVRDAEIVYLVSEGNSYETVAGIFGLSPKTIKNLVGQSKECLANPHGYAAKNADIRPVVDEPSSVPALALRGPKSAPGKAAREKRRRTFEQRTERRQSEVERLAEEGVVPAEIADRLGLSDRVVSRHLTAWRKRAA